MHIIRNDNGDVVAGFEGWNEYDHMKILKNNFKTSLEAKHPERKGWFFILKECDKYHGIPQTLVEIYNDEILPKLRELFPTGVYEKDDNVIAVTVDAFYSYHVYIIRDLIKNYDIVYIE